MDTLVYIAAIACLNVDVLKSYTCACGWMAEAETLDELTAAIRKHGETHHSEVEIDVDKICAYLEEKYRE